MTIEFHANAGMTELGAIRTAIDIAYNLRSSVTLAHNERRVVVDSTSDYSERLRALRETPPKDTVTASASEAHTPTVDGALVPRRDLVEKFNQLRPARLLTEAEYAVEEAICECIRLANSIHKVAPNA